MKKRLFINVILLIVLLSLTGCGKNTNNDNKTSTTQQGSNNRKLSCVIEEKDKKTTKNKKLIINYTDNKINKISTELVVKYSSGKIDSKESKKIKDNCSNAVKNKGVTCSSNTTKDSISVNYVFSVDKIDEDGKKIDGYKAIDEYVDKNYDELKRLLEEANYICN